LTKGATLVKGKAPTKTDYRKMPPEMIHQHELKAEDVHAYALKVLKKYLRIEANGYCFKTDMIYDVLMKASAEPPFITGINTCAKTV
jgi:hypothetical protein